MNALLELIQWETPQGGDYQGEKYLLASNAERVLCRKGRKLFCGITKGNALAIDEIFREANLGLKLERTFYQSCTKIV